MLKLKSGVAGDGLAAGLAIVAKVLDGTVLRGASGQAMQGPCRSIGRARAAGGQGCSHTLPGPACSSVDPFAARFSICRLAQTALRLRHDRLPALLPLPTAGLLAYARVCGGKRQFTDGSWSRKCALPIQFNAKAWVRCDGVRTAIVLDGSIMKEA